MKLTYPRRDNTTAKAAIDTPVGWLRAGRILNMSDGADVVDMI